MKKLLLVVFLVSISSTPGYAVQPIITETDTSITVEYTGTPEDTPAVTNGKEVSPDSKTNNPPASEVLIPASKGYREATSEEIEARKAQREAQRAERTARRSKREPRGSQSGGEDE